MFKIAVLLIVIIIGAYNFLVKSEVNTLAIIDNDVYDVEYNEKLDEYYVTIKNNPSDDALKLTLDLYVSNNIETLNLKYYDASDNELASNDFNKTDAIVVTANTTTDNYYIISNSKKDKESIKVFVYYDEEVDSREE